jgi:serine protease AprX
MTGKKNPFSEAYGKGRQQESAATNNESVPPGFETDESNSGKVPVMIEIDTPAPTMAMSSIESEFRAKGVSLNPDFRVQMEPAQAGMSGEGQRNTIILQGETDVQNIEQLKSAPNVRGVWVSRKHALRPMSCPENWPNPPCDCDSNTPKGTIDEVARYLEVDKIWRDGFKGDGITVAVVDGGITAVGRPVRQGETPEIERVTNGWPIEDWGCTANSWGDHGNMCATDVLGIAPEVQLYDIRISDAGASDQALLAIDWAIRQHKKDGTPHILTNSWGVWNVNHDPDYAQDPNHPTTRKYLEAINEGILVLFAAGNCGLPCGSSNPSYCGNSRGPGKSILATNGHQSVISVGAVNMKEQYVGYSSQGKSIHGADKPDICSITHFKAYYDDADSGTSAATPIAAGVVALLKQANPAFTQDQAKELLRNTAKDIGSTGPDPYAGFGIIQPRAAYDKMGIRSTAATGNK